LGFEGAIIPNPYPGFVGGNIWDADPEAGNAALPAWLKFPVNPHAMTVPYDVEAVWVFDDRDSRWSDQAPNARATYPAQGSHPGYDDNFAGNWGGGVGPNDFFSMNDFNPEYYYVTGVNFPGKTVAAGGTGSAALGTGIIVPPQLMSGISGVRIDIEAQVGQTVLVRALDGAYYNITLRFPVPVTVIAWDGRALGVAPYNACNHAYEVPANTPIHTSVARRFDALIRLDPAEYPDGYSGFVEVDFTDTRCGIAGVDPGTGDPFARPVVFTGRIPINIGAANAPVTGTILSGGVALESVPVRVTGTGIDRTVLTRPDGRYSVPGLPAGTYTFTPTLAGYEFSPAGATVNVPGDLEADFSATQVTNTWAISGAVVESRGAQLGIPRIVVELTGGPAGFVPVMVVTDDKGHYHFAGLQNGAYTVTPGMQITLNAWNPGDPITANTPMNLSYAFSPTMTDVAVEGANKKLSFLRGRRLHTTDASHGA
jgi:hypothetical protein